MPSGPAPAPVLDPAGLAPRRAPLRLRRMDGSGPAAAEARRLPPWPMVVLLVAWTVPWIIQVGTLRLSLYRIALLVLLVPCLAWWVGGKAGRIRTADIALLLFSLWGMFGLTVQFGLQAGVQTGGVLFLETMGAWLVARCSIRTAEDFRAMVRMLFWIVIFLLPFALVEAVTGRKVLLELFSLVLPTPMFIATEPRWGFSRVQGIFDHPILMGVCCGSILAMTHMVLGYGRSPVRRWTASGLVALTAGLSFSSGPWSSMVMQGALMAWNRVLRRLRWRWKLLLGLAAFGLVVVQLFARRPLPNILFGAFAFDPYSAFFRILIWQFGTQSVANHVWFGVGMGEWDRPAWMPPSIDMFWLYNAVTYGLPGGLLMLAAFLSAVISVSLRKGLDDRLYTYRAAFLMAMAALFQMGWMVHFWNSTYVLFLLLLGSGMWLLDARPEGEPAPARGRAATRPQRRAAPRRGRSRPPVDAVTWA